MKLYQIANEFQKISSILADMNLTDEEIKDNLASVQLDADQKVLNTAAVIKNLQIDIDALKVHEKVISDRRKRIEKRVGEIQDYLLFNMKKLNIKRVHGIEFDVSVQKNPPRADIISEKDIQQKYMKEEFIVKVDKSKIRQDLLNGLEVDGAKLIQDEKIVIK